MKLRLGAARTVALLAALGACSSSHRPPGPPGPGWRERGVASWYGPGYHGRQTASGERFDMHALTAAHPSLPFDTRLRVRSLLNGREVSVRVNDRGPFVDGRVVDLSFAAAPALGLIGPGTGLVELSVDPLRSSPVPVPVPDGAARLTVQIGAFGEQDNALRLQERIAADYPDVDVVASTGLWRVQVGRDLDRPAAAELAARLERDGWPVLVRALP